MAAVKPGEIKRAMERRRFAPGHRGPVMASLPPSSLKGVCKHKVCLLCPGAKLLVCYICVLLRLFLIWCNFQHAVIYQEKPHGRFFFFCGDGGVGATHSSLILGGVGEVQRTNKIL